MTPIQQRNVIRWIEALLSGRYNKGIGCLYDPSTDCYCVNGVLAGPVAGFPFNKEREHFVFGRYADVGDILMRNWYSDAFLPIGWFKQFTGLPVPQERFSSMNDVGSSTFLSLGAYLISFLPDGPEKERLTAKAGALWDDLLKLQDEDSQGEKGVAA